jgi:hypothetical protein
MSLIGSVVSCRPAFWEFLYEYGNFGIGIGIGMGITWHSVIEKVIGGVDKRTCRSCFWVLQSWQA